MPDTLFANVTATGQAMIQRAQALQPGYAPLMNLVTRVPIPKGKTQADLPYVTSLATVQSLTEGDEVVLADQFTIGSVSITPGIKAIKFRISKRAERFSQEQLTSLVADEMAMAEAQNVDELLGAQFTNAHTDNDVGTTNVDLVFSTLRTAKRLLRTTTRINGGPPRKKINVVIGGIPEEDLLTNLGAQGVVASTAPWIPEGMSRDIMESYAVPGGQLLGAGIYMDSYLTQNGSGDFLCCMFSEDFLFYVYSQEWEHDVFNESEWLGVILRADADYGVGVGPFTHHGVQITADGA